METNNKLREALDDIGNAAAWVRDNCYDTTNQTQNYMEDIIAKVRLALAEPVKNCEVGTVAEQADRFQKFCLSRTQPWHGCDGTCPVLMSEKCALNWAQMPYEEGGDNV